MARDQSVKSDARMASNQKLRHFELHVAIEKNFSSGAGGGLVDCF
jgi:hypothetical protein